MRALALLLVSALSGAELAYGQESALDAPEAPLNAATTPVDAAITPVDAAITPVNAATTPVDAARLVPEDAWLMEPRAEPPLVGSILVGTGVALAGVGALGMLSSGGCDTRDARMNCLDPSTPHAVFPALVVVGLSATMVGAYWLRHDAPRPKETTP